MGCELLLEFGEVASESIVRLRQQRLILDMENSLDHRCTNPFLRGHACLIDAARNADKIAEMVQNISVEVKEAIEKLVESSREAHTCELEATLKEFRLLERFTG